MHVLPLALAFSLLGSSVDVCVEVFRVWKCVRVEVGKAIDDELVTVTPPTHKNVEAESKI